MSTSLSAEVASAASAELLRIAEAAGDPAGQRALQAELARPRSRFATALRRRLFRG